MVLDGAVATVSRSRTLDTDVQTVWEVLADFAAISSWAGNVDHSCLLNAGADPIGLTRRVQTGAVTVTEQITEFDPPRMLAYRIDGLPRIAGTVQNRWELRSAAGDSTIATVTSVVHAGDRPRHRLAEAVLCRVLARQSDEMLAGLAARWESAHAR
jgi:uncharacterized protein YndB with AHSA1/START domain